MKKTAGFQFLLLAVSAALAQQATLKGVVLTMTGKPIANATVQFKGLTAKTMTDAQGRYDFANPVGVRKVEGYHLRMQPREGGLVLDLDRRERISIELFSLSGQRIRQVADGVYPAGISSFDLKETGNGAMKSGRVFLVKVAMGGRVGWHKLTTEGELAVMTGSGESSGLTQGTWEDQGSALSKSSATSDSLYITHPLYHGGMAAINGRMVTSYAGTQNFRMFSSDKGWDVCAPAFDFKFDQSPGALYYQKIMKGPAATNQEALREVCQSIWTLPADVPANERFKTYTANINAGVTTDVASTTLNGPELNFNVGYINDQKGNGDAAAWYELVGVLVHEGTHSYQPYYDTPGAEGFGEAMPDAVRALTGFFKWPTGAKCTGSFTGYYQEGGRYWYFIEQKHPGFLNGIYKLTNGDISTRVQQVTGESLSSMVSECQTKGMP